MPGLGLKQTVSEPAREDHLVDLVLTDIPTMKAGVIPGIADNCMVQTSLRFKVPERTSVEREVWQFNEADWLGSRKAIGEEDWDFIRALGADEAAADFAACLMGVAGEHIPKRQLSEKKRAHIPG